MESARLEELGPGDLNSGPHAYVASPLLPEPSPQPPASFCSLLLSQAFGSFWLDSWMLVNALTLASIQIYLYPHSINEPDVWNGSYN